MHPLNGPRLKFRRAGKHLDAIKVAIAHFLASKPYDFVLEADPKPPNYSIVARVRHLPDKEWGLIVGDFAHNARSALDLLVYQLSQLPLDDERRFKLEFPIFDEVKSYTNKVVQRYLAGVAPEHIAIIEGFQPYNGLKGSHDDALGILHAINNADKHRIINIVGAVGSLDAMGLGGGRVGTNIFIGKGPAVNIGRNSSVNFGNGCTYKTVGDGVIDKDRTIVAKLISNTPPQWNFYPRINITIQFGEGAPRVQGRSIVNTLTLIYDRVKEVIERFESNFSQ
jgi:hypothetical protein